MNKVAVRRWILPLLRYGLCVAAVLYLVYKVPWYDRVRLGGKDGPQYRLLEQGVEGVQIERDGGRTTVPWSEVHSATTKDGAQVPDIELSIPSVVRGANRGLALWAILLFGPVWFIQAYRLVLMVAVQGVRVSYWNATKLTFAGNFFNFALPGTTGGDVYKAYYLAKYTHRKTEVVTTVFLDRAIGLLGVVILAAAGILMKWNPDEFRDLVMPLVIAFAALGVGCVLVFSGRVRRALGLAGLAARLPFGAQILRVGRATVALRQHKWKVALAMLLTLVLQSIVMVSAAFMGWALGMHGGLEHYFVYVSIGFLIAAIPIAPPQAFGVMEYAYVQFFTHGGLATASQAVAFALAVRLIQLVWAIPGVLVPLLGAHRPSTTELANFEVGEGTAGLSPGAGPLADGASPAGVP
jgi:glycosyltransferase 2 family protein